MLPIGVKEQVPEKDANGADGCEHQPKAQARGKLATNDPDPIVKIAATKARDITDLEYNKQ